MHVYPVLVHAPVSGGTIPPTKISKNRVFSLNGAYTTMRGKGIDLKGVRFLKQIVDMKSSDYAPLYISFYFKLIRLHGGPKTA